MTEHWSTTESSYFDRTGHYISKQVNFHGPDGLHACVQFLDRNGKPSIMVRASVAVEVNVERMEVVHGSDDEEEAV